MYIYLCMFIYMYICLHLYVCIYIYTYIKRKTKTINIFVKIFWQQLLSASVNIFRVN